MKFVELHQVIDTADSICQPLLIFAKNDYINTTVLQLPYHSAEIIELVRAVHIQRKLVKDHQVSELLAGGVGPGFSQADFGRAVIVPELLPFGFDQKNASVSGIDDEIGIMIEKSVDSKTGTFEISVPPDDIGQGRKQIRDAGFKAIHRSF